MIGESSIIVPSALPGTGKWRSSGREQAGGEYECCHSGHVTGPFHWICKGSRIAN